MSSVDSNQYMVVTVPDYVPNILVKFVSPDIFYLNIQSFVVVGPTAKLFDILEPMKIPVPIYETYFSGYVYFALPVTSFENFSLKGYKGFSIRDNVLRVVCDYRLLDRNDFRFYTELVWLTDDAVEAAVANLYAPEKLAPADVLDYSSSDKDEPKEESKEVDIPKAPISEVCTPESDHDRKVFPKETYVEMHHIGKILLHPNGKFKINGSGVWTIDNIKGMITIPFEGGIIPYQHMVKAYVEDENTNMAWIVDANVNAIGNSYGPFDLEHTLNIRFEGKRHRSIAFDYYEGDYYYTVDNYWRPTEVVKKKKNLPNRKTREARKLRSRGYWLADKNNARALVLREEFLDHYPKAVDLGEQLRKTAIKYDSLGAKLEHMLLQVPAEKFPAAGRYVARFLHKYKKLLSDNEDVFIIKDNTFQAMVMSIYSLNKWFVHNDITPQECTTKVFARSKLLPRFWKYTFDADYSSGSSSN